MWNETMIDPNLPQTKENLLDLWSKFKNIPERYNEPDDKFRHLLPYAYRLVDISDLDDWIANYDLSEIGNERYHRPMGKKFVGFENFGQDYERYPQSAFEVTDGGYALKKMAQQILARCYIKMNRLLHGEEPVWEAEMNRLATNWTWSSLEREFDNRVGEEVIRLPQLLQVALENQTATQQLQLPVGNGY